jgi:glycosyltransferase involved in cell wall biosynthesis
MVTAQDGCESFRPVCIAEWDILDPFPAIHLGEPGDHGGGSVHLLVRLGTEPLGYTDLEFEDAGSLSGAAAASASQSFRCQVNARLAESGLPLISEIPADGLPLDPNQLAFVAERKRLLENAPHISVVVCTRDRPTRVADCVSQLACQEYPSYEIVVVDNAPADPGAVPAVVESLDVCVPVRYVLEARAGLAWARNAGWRAAKADIIAFLDDQEVPDRYWLAEIVRGFSVRSKVGCVTGPVLPAELRTEPQQWFEQLGGYRQGREFNREIFELGRSRSPLWPHPPFGLGGNMAFHREVLVDIGGFHVSLGAGTPTMGGEDTFAFTRTLLARHTVVYQPTALVFHYHRDTLAALKRQLHGYGTGEIAFYAALIAYQPKLLFPLLWVIAIKSNSRGQDAVPTSTMRSFPVNVLRRELQRGMRRGIPAYVRSVMKQRGIRDKGPTPC